MVNDLDTIHLRSHAEGICRDYEFYSRWAKMVVRDMPSDSYMYEYSLDILCLMALTEALGLEYGDYMKNLGG